MTMTNPFNITFGKEPISKINREVELDEIKESFSYDNPPSEVYILTGPRGSGKTVALTTLSEYYSSQSNFICVELNPEIDMLEQLASKLYDKGKLRKLFVKTEFNFSFYGVSLSIKGDNPLTNISTLLEKIFEYLKRKEIKVLITVDEVVNNAYMKIFSHEYQSIIRKNYKVFLIMTGLYENISKLENEKSLTFLYRAPKIYLNSLSLRSITTSYQEIFDITKEKAMELAKITKGYAFAYQLLGYILFKNNKKEVDQKVYDEFDELLENRVYAKIWKSITNKEKEILKLVSLNKNTNQEILSELNMSQGTLSVYKKRLEKMGIIDTKDRGIIAMKLPRFSEFIRFNIEIE
ncbi:MAG: ArsR family transcriptional regulator [Acholeplasmatales bacterium]|nr:ArsR family transcriptional regulator [Acholeplasmatales bacterium]